MNEALLKVFHSQQVEMLQRNVWLNGFACISVCEERGFPQLSFVRRQVVPQQANGLQACFIRIPSVSHHGSIALTRNTLSSPRSEYFWRKIYISMRVSGFPLVSKLVTERMISVHCRRYIVVMLDRCHRPCSL